MSINWVVVENDAPFPLQGERISYSQDGVDISLYENKSVEKKEITTIKCRGTVYASTKRVMFVASKNQPVTYRVAGKGDRTFVTFAVDMKKSLRGGKIVQPWLGPNYWQAIVLPLADGGLEPSNEPWNLQFTFNSGGTLDFHRFVVNAQQVSEDEQLPAYSE